MLEMKSKTIALAVVAVAVICMAWTGQAVGVMTNVAYSSAVSSTVEGATYAQPVPLVYSDWRPVLSDDIWYQGPKNYCYVNRNTGASFYWDLGEEFDLDYVEVIPRGATASYWEAGLAGVRVLGYAADKSTLIGEFTVPSGLSTQPCYGENVNWQGVQWLRIWDQNDTAGDDDPTLAELRALADAPAYANFIGDVGVTATNENSSVRYQAASLTNNRGMTDQGGAGAADGVGNPAAKSICTSGNYLSSNLLYETEPGSGIYVYDDDPVLTFDLGGEAVLDEMRIWNFNFSSTNTTSTATEPPVTDYTHRGTQHCLIEYSDDDGATYIALPDANGGADGNYTIGRAAASTAEPDDPIFPSMWNYVYAMNEAELVIPLTDLSADHIRITPLSNFADDSATASYRGLSEVRFYGEVTPDPIPGDANNSGTVDSADAIALAENWGAVSQTLGLTWWEMGDFDGDEVVGPRDAAIMAANWGYGVPAPASAVPEPSTIVLLLMLALGGALSRRTR
ncbi:MAG: PEP-CTERM sorting domain-containing protein [Pirellulales bacterium]|nr:PEP-CTERM sorting domain-containing protein [Pirellulales bacterium]